MHRFIFSISILFSVVHCDLFTLKNKTHIYCTHNDIFSPIYVWPPPEITYEKREEKKTSSWSKDWVTKNSTNLPLHPVLDTRWNDFPLIRNSNYQNFDLKTSVSISVYSPGKINIFAFNEEESLVAMTKLNEKWQHFTVLSENKSVYIFQNNKIVDFKHNFIATKVVFQSSHKTYWKEHKYDFMWSNETSDDESSYLEIPSTEKTCLLLYTSLCRDCFIEIITDRNKKKHITPLKSQETVNKLDDWQVHKFHINANEENLIKFRKRKNGGENSEGYWAVDYDFCDSLNIISYRNNLLGNEYKCESLNKINNNNNDVFNCKPGTFGEKCIYNCTTIFGSQYQYCEEYKICHETMCECAWGAEGDFCEKQCPLGKWGISCKNQCPTNCNYCNKITGECSIKTSEIFSQKTLWIIIIILLVVLVIISLIFAKMLCLIFVKKSGKHKASNHEKITLITNN